MAQFAFRFHPIYRLAALPFGVMPRTSVVEVVDGDLIIRFGLWTLRTPVANIASCQRTGPYSIPKTAGPAHLSLVDRGVTFATNPDAGLCLCFTEPVSAIDPFGRIRHPGATVTVDRLDDLERALSERLDGDDLEELSQGPPCESPWTVARRWAVWPAGMMLASVRYLRTLSEVDRRFESRPGPGPSFGEEVEGEGVQPASSGVGPLFERTYGVKISGSTLTPEQLVERVASNFNRASPVEVAEFIERKPVEGGHVGTEYQVRMPGPWDGPVRVVEKTPTSIRLITLDGHMEAGQIEFRAAWEGDPPVDGAGILVFEIRSLARSGDRAFGALYDRLLMAQEMQLHMWVHFCRRVAEVAGGTVVGNPEVRTVRYEPSNAGSP